MGMFQVYESRLPWHGFATDDLHTGIRMYAATEAIKKAIIQHNAKHSVGWLVYDMDSPTAGTDWIDRNGPAPNILAINPDNGHGHYLYGLSEPVHDYTGSSQKALRYLGAVDVALTNLLGADPGYSKLLSKNPLHDRWSTGIPRQRLYTLDELAQGLDLDDYSDRRRRLPTVGLGRNCTLFETLRIWAYRARRQPFLSEELFHDSVLNRALQINATFTPPLPHSEVRSTAKSVSRWTWRRMSLEGFRAHQTALSTRAAIKRSWEASQLRQRIVETFHQCPALTQEDIGAMFGVARETVNRHLRAAGLTGVTAPISDKCTLTSCTGQQASIVRKCDIPLSEPMAGAL